MLYRRLSAAIAHCAPARDLGSRVSGLVFCSIAPAQPSATFFLSRTSEWPLRILRIHLTSDEGHFKLITTFHFKDSFEVESRGVPAKKIAALMSCIGYPRHQNLGPCIRQHLCSHVEKWRG